MASIRTVTAVSTVLLSFVALLYKPVALRVEVLGLTRPLDKIQNIHGDDFRLIPDTLYCEDLHYHEHSNLLFGASEERPETRWKWFPPVANFDDSHALDRGTIIVVNPETKRSTRLFLTNFLGPFITHGIDIWSPKDDPDSVYIFAVNHLPNPAFALANATDDVTKARSQIEIFHHRIGTSEAEHLRTIWHPTIRTPNDIYAINAHAVYFTNDHYYRGGHLRTVEDLMTTSRWSDVIHLEISELNAKDPSQGIKATVANDATQNPNGLGHGKDEDEVLVNRAAAGIMEIARREGSKPHLKFIETVQLPNTVDNPTYFHDPYAAETGHDASGYVIAGLARAYAFPSHQDPVTVYLIAASGDRTQKLLFQDDGKLVSSASTAILIAIDPKKNGGKKQAWLFVTGPTSKSMASSMVDL